MPAPSTPPVVTPDDLLGTWCDRAGSSDSERQRTMLDIGLTYITAQEASCPGLTRGMNPEQKSDWINYMIDYTFVMAGCLQLSEPPPNGIRAFGPANTAAVGLTHPSMSQEDASLLIDRYVDAFALALGLGSEDRALVQSHLQVAAESEIEPSDSAVLVVCTSPRDAGNL